MAQEPKTQTRHGKTLYAACREFCENTSVHGLRQIAEAQPYIIRRLVWLVLVLIGLTLFLYQMITGIVYYYEYPVTVNVKINYNDTIRFPALTLCNQNAFRKTVSAENGWYFLLSDIFSRSKMKGVDLARYNATDLELYDIYNIAGHDKDDLIVKCQWDGQPCSPQDFITTMTDYGKCYTFNGNKTSPKHAWRTGADGGLRLLVNVEQYEYMPGPNQGAGLRVHLHSQQEAPLVSDFGIAMAPGSHDLVGITVLVVKNLPHPHGKCDSKKLQYYDVYTKKNCLESCKQEWLEGQCGCKHINMVNNTYSQKYCNLTKYQECVVEKFDHFHQMHIACDCSIPCEMQSLELFGSFGDISGFDALNLLNSPLTAILQSRFLTAREVTQRVNDKIVEKDRYMIRTLQQSAGELEVFLRQITAHLNHLWSWIDNYFAILEQRITFHKRRGLKKVLYIMEHDFVRGWEIIEERTLPYLTFGFYELRARFRRAIDGIQGASNGSEQEQTLALSRWTQVEENLLSRLNIVRRVFDNVTEIHQSYKTGVPLIRFRASKDRRYDMSWITVDLLQAVIDDSGHDQDEIYSNLIRRLRSVNSSIHIYLEMGRNFISTYNIDQAKWISTDRAFRSACTSYNYHIFLYKERIVDGPVIVANKKIKEFELLNITSHSAKDSLLLTISLLNDSIQKIQNESWVSIKTTLEYASLYLKDNRTTKTMLAERATSHDIIQTFNDIELFFSNVRSTGWTIKEKLQTVEMSVANIWKNMLNEYTTINFYAMVHDDFINSSINPDFYLPYLAYLLSVSERTLAGTAWKDIEYRLNADFHTMNLSAKLDEASRCFHDLEASTDIDSLLGRRDHSFSTDLQRLVNSLEVFTKETQIDESFYLNNFIQLDVFMQELSYEEIVQQPGYDMLNLLGDIGGSVGLFLGASALTIAEILDVLVLQIVRAAFK